MSGGVLRAGGSPAGCLQRCRVVLSAAAVDAGLAGVLGHLIQGGAPASVLSLLVGEQVGEQQPAVPSWLVVRDLAVFQELDQGRGGEAGEVRGPLGGAAPGRGGRG